MTEISQRDLMGCDACKATLEPGDLFCPECGKPVPEAMGKTSQVKATEPVPVEQKEKPQRFNPVNAVRQAKESILEAVDQIKEEVKDHSLSQPEKVVAAETIAESVEAAACPEMNVFYNHDQIMLAGAIVPFDFKINPRTDGISRLVVVVEAENITRLVKEPPQALRRGLDMEMSINFRPDEQLSGRVAFNIFIGFLHHGREKWYMATRQHMIYRSRSLSEQKTSQEIHFNMNGAQVNRAGEVNVAVDLGKRDASKSFDFEQLNAGPRWDLLKLYPCLPQMHLKKEPKLKLHPERIPDDALADRLTLVNGDTRIHILGNEKLILGKNRSCDIVSRTLYSDGEMDSSLNRRVSRLHASFICKENKVYLLDQVEDPKNQQLRKSMNGVFVNGNKIPPGQAVELKSGTPCEVGLGGVEEDQGNFLFTLNMLTCGDLGLKALHKELGWKANEPACMILERTDGIPESFVVVWRYFWGRAFKGNRMSFPDNTVVAQYQGGFFAGDWDPNELDYHWLRPGREKMLQGWDVCKWQQAGKWAEVNPGNGI